MELSDREKEILADLIKFAWANGGVRTPEVSEVLKALDKKLVEKK